MPITIQCPACKASLNVRDDLIGKAVRCPRCRATVPGSAEGPAPIPVAAQAIRPATAPPPPTIRKVLPTTHAGPPPPIAQSSNTAAIVLTALGAGALLLAFLCIVSLAAIQFLGTQASITFSTVGQAIMDDEPVGPGPAPFVKPVSTNRPLNPTGQATLRGQVTYDGPPRPAAPAWQIGKDGGVAHAAVWLRPPNGWHFPPVPPERRNWKNEVTVEARAKEFVPRVTVLFAGMQDGDRRLVPSGQAFRFVNPGPGAQNVNFRGDVVEGIAGNFNLAPRDTRRVELPPHHATVIQLQSDRVPAMRGYIWSLDTPYAAVTDLDGSFVIDQVPAGVELQLVGWHEEDGFFVPGGFRGEAIKLQPGANIRNLSLSQR